MLSWDRRVLVSLGLCALLSLVFPSVAALACPGSGSTSLTLTPSSFRFSREVRTRTFTVTYVAGSYPTERVFKHTSGGWFSILPIERDGCREVTLEVGRSCNFDVTMTFEPTESGTLRAELTHSTAREASLIGP